jgi:putative cell wall-binding protein
VKLKYFSLILVLVLIFNLTGTGFYALAEGTKPTIESMTINKSDVTLGDSVKVNVKIKEFQDYRYLNLMYNAPGANQVITVQLDFNEQSGAYIGELPVTEYMKSGEYTPFSLAFYGSTVTSVDNDEVNLVEAMKFTVNGTSGQELIKSIEVDNKDTVPGEAVKISLKVSETKGIRYFNASFLSPITKRSLSISMDYNSDTQAYEGVIPISSITESGLYKPFRVTSYGYGGNDISYSGSQYEELLQGGSFTVSGTDPGNLIEKIIVNKQQLTVGETLHFAVDAPSLTGVSYMNVNYTSPITGKSFHVDLNHNNETNMFEGSMVIPEDFELGTYSLFMIAIYDEYNTTALYRDEFQQLEQGDFTIYKDETPPAFLSLSVDKKQAEAGESVRVNVGASDNSKVHSAVIKYITPNNNQLSLDLPYDRNSDTLSGVLPIDKESEPGTWKVHSIIIKDIHQNEVIVRDDAISLDNGDFTVIDTTPPSFPRVNEVTDQTTEVTGTAEATTDITVKKGTVVLGIGAASETGDFVITIPQQAAGTELQVFAVDKTGNESEPAKTIVQDITAPSMPEVNEITDASTAIIGKAEAESTVIALNGAKEIGRGIVGTDGTFSIAIEKQAANSVVAISVQDTAGNVSKPTEVMIVDATAPIWPEDTRIEAFDVKERELILSWSRADDQTGVSKYLVYQDNQLFQEVEAGEMKLHVSKLSPGHTYQFEVIPEDAEGNRGKAQQIKVKTKGQSVKTIFGSSRYTTAIEVSKSGWDKAETVILARGYDFPDALSGAPLAYQMNAPMLLTSKEKLTPETKSELVRLQVKNVLILGGTNALSSEVEKELKDLGLKVERIAGKNRYDTAAKIAKRMGGNPEKAIVAYGQNFPDALAVASYAAMNGYPILLTDKEKIPNETGQALDNIKETILVGGTQVISNTVMKDLPDPRRISGKNRFDTAVQLIEALDLETEKVYVTTGWGFADALTGSVLAAREGAPLLLVSPDKMPEEVKALKEERNLTNFTILGGMKAVDPGMFEEQG